MRFLKEFHSHTSPMIRHTVVFLLTALSVLMLSGLACAQEYDYCIHDVNIISPEKANPLRSSTDVFIADGKIVKITSAAKNAPVNCKKTIEAKGKYLMAGLTDMHVHLPANGTDTFLTLNLAAGVTTIRAMRGRPWQLDVKKKIASGELLGPDLYVSSPYFPNKNIKIDKLDDSIAFFKQAGYDLVKVLAVPDSAYYEALMKAANKAHITVAGHWPWQVPIERVIESGYDCIEHLQGLDEAYEKDTSSVVRLAKLLNKHHTWNCPTLDFYNVYYHQVPLEELKKRPGLDLVGKERLNEWIEFMTKSFAKYNAGSGDSVEQKHKKWQQYMANKLALLRRLNELKVPLIFSPADAYDDFGVPGFCVWEEMKLYSKAGIPNKDILKMATYNAADYFHQTDSWGSVAVGRKANMVLLDKNPLQAINNIEAQEGVFIGGKYYETSALKDKCRKL